MGACTYPVDEVASVSWLSVTPAKSSVYLRDKIQPVPLGHNTACTSGTQYSLYLRDTIQPVPLGHNTACTPGTQYSLCLWDTIQRVPLGHNTACTFGTQYSLYLGVHACWLLNVPATCKCISWTDLLRQFYVLSH